MGGLALLVGGFGFSCVALEKKRNFTYHHENNTLKPRTTSVSFFLSSAHPRTRGALVRSARFTILDCSFVANEVDSVAGSMIDLNGGDGFEISDFRSVHMVNNTGFSTLNFNTLIAWQCQVRFEDGGW